MEAAKTKQTLHLLLMYFGSTLAAFPNGSNREKVTDVVGNYRREKMLVSDNKDKRLLQRRTQYITYHRRRLQRLLHHIHPIFLANHPQFAS